MFTSHQRDATPRQPAGRQRQRGAHARLAWRGVAAVAAGRQRSAGVASQHRGLRLAPLEYMGAKMPVSLAGLTAGTARGGGAGRGGSS